MMFDLQATAELRQINVRVEFHGEEHVKAVDALFLANGVPAERLTTAVPDLRKKFYDKDQPLLQEIYPLKVRHKIENVEATVKIGKKKFTYKGGDVAKIQITPQPMGVCDVRMKIQMSGLTDAALLILTDALREDVELKVIERQKRLDDQ